MRWTEKRKSRGQSCRALNNRLEHFDLHRRPLCKGGLVIKVVFVKDCSGNRVQEELWQKGGEP